MIELGCGTARSLELFGERLAAFESVEAVDLCPALLAVAHRRMRNWRNVSLIEADVTEYRPATAPDCVYFCYVLTMSCARARRWVRSASRVLNASSASTMVQAFG